MAKRWYSVSVLSNFEKKIAEQIRTAVEDRHGLPVADVRVVPAGSIPRTTSGKLARLACRDAYVAGAFG